MDEGWTTPLDGHWSGVQTAHPARQRELVLARQKRAWTDLETDFRGRVARGRVALDGLQSKPTLARSRSPIPATWAPLLRFRVTKNEVIAGDAKFIEVIASRLVPPMPVVTGHVPTEEATENVRGIPKRPRGREPVSSLIEADLRTHWEDATQRAAKSKNGVPVWSELARAVRRRLLKAHGRRVAQIPHEETIRKHLPRIYKRLLGDLAGRK